MEELYKPHEITVIDSEGDKLTLTICWDADIYEWQDKFKVILKWLTFGDELINDIFCDDECEFKTQEEMNKQFEEESKEEDKE
jgi:hypothetical protein